MIRIVIVCVSLVAWPAIAFTQDALDLVSLTFSPGPVSGDVIPEAAAVDEGSSVPGSGAPGDLTSLIPSIREAEDEVTREEALNGSSRGLIEPLKSVAELYREVGDYPLAIAALQRAREIARAHDGLHSLSQIEIMATMIDWMEEAGAYYESDSLQAEILELASRNEGDPRVPSILVAIADRQMDAVTEYFTAGGWKRSLERIDAAHGWDLQNIDFLRSSTTKKPLNRLDALVQEVLTNGSYEIGDTLDSRAVLMDTYAMIDVINDHNEAGQRSDTAGSLIFDVEERQRDLALSAFRRARRLYSSALQTVLDSEGYGSGEYLATEQRMIDTYYFELEHEELYPRPAGLRSRSDGRQGRLKRVVYGSGTSVLEAKVVNLLSYGASAVEIAKALMEVGDWHLIFSANRRALEMYQDAHDLLVREDVPGEALDELVSPATPVILAELTSDDRLAFDPTHTYVGYIDVAVETGRFGEVKEVHIVNRSVGTSPNVERRARTHVFETRFRPRFENGQPVRSDRFNLRYHYDYSARE